jgi:hypothetical protein
VRPLDARLKKIENELRKWSKRCTGGGCKSTPAIQSKPGRGEASPDLVLEVRAEIKTLNVVKQLISHLEGPAAGAAASKKSRNRMGKNAAKKSGKGKNAAKGGTLKSAAKGGIGKSASKKKKKKSGVGKSASTKKRVGKGQSASTKKRVGKGKSASTKSSKGKSASAGDLWTGAREWEASRGGSGNSFSKGKRTSKSGKGKGASKKSGKGKSTSKGGNLKGKSASAGDLQVASGATEGEASLPQLPQSAAGQGVGIVEVRHISLLPVGGRGVAVPAGTLSIGNTSSTTTMPERQA